MKKVLSVIAVLCLLTTLLPGVVTAETYENLTYSVSGGKATITGCDSSVTGEVIIPDAIAGYPVTKIGLSAFADCTGMTAITIGKNVTTIGNQVFSGCDALESITVAMGNPVYHSAGNCLIENSSKTLIAGCKNSIIPADGTVTAIHNMAFYNCNGLTTITVPDSVKTIGASAFEGCEQLSVATIGKNVTAIGNSAFFGCTSLEKIAIPDNVTAMGVYVFSGCTALESAAIGDGVTTIGNSVFSGCSALTELTLGKSVETVDVFAFNGCEKLEKVTLPASVTTIGRFAFYNCGSLESVWIPKSVSAIGNNAFAGCDDLRLSIAEENTYAVTYAKNNNILYTVAGIDGMAVTNVVLRPGAAGVYFKSNLDWAANDAEILSYGIAVSVENANPVADGSDATSLYTVGGTSVLIKDILKTDNTAAENGRNARMVIYARAYVQLASGVYVYSDAVEVNLQQVVIAAQNKWDSLSDAQKDALQQMYDTYADVMRGWKVPNLKNN